MLPHLQLPMKYGRQFWAVFRTGTGAARVDAVACSMKSLSRMLPTSTCNVKNSTVSCLTDMLSSSGTISETYPTKIICSVGGKVDLYDLFLSRLRLRCVTGPHPRSLALFGSRFHSLRVLDGQRDRVARGE